MHLWSFQQQKCDVLFDLYLELLRFSANLPKPLAEELEHGVEDFRAGNTVVVEGVDATEAACGGQCVRQGIQCV